MNLFEKPKDDLYEDVKASDNKKNMKNVLENWHLGPIKASTDRNANTSFWKGIASIWMMNIDKARRRTCGNCEYGDLSPKAIEAMENIPDDEFDKDGGGRVWCHKFDFVCHNLRTCQAWDNIEDNRTYGEEE